MRREWAEHRRDDHDDESGAPRARPPAAARRTLGRGRQATCGPPPRSAPPSSTRAWRRRDATAAATGTTPSRSPPGSVADAGCENLSIGATRGPYAHLCQKHTDEAREAKSAKHREVTTASYARGDRQQAFHDWVNVPDTGLRYRTSLEAYLAADEIEHLAEGVAAARRVMAAISRRPRRRSPTRPCSSGTIREAAAAFEGEDVASEPDEPEPSGNDPEPPARAAGRATSDTRGAGLGARARAPAHPARRRRRPVASRRGDGPRVPRNVGGPDRSCWALPSTLGSAAAARDDDTRAGDRGAPRVQPGARAPADDVRVRAAALDLDREAPLRGTSERDRGRRVPTSHGRTAPPAPSQNGAPKRASASRQSRWLREAMIEAIQEFHAEPPLRSRHRRRHRKGHSSRSRRVLPS